MVGQFSVRASSTKVECKISILDKDTLILEKIAKLFKTSVSNTNKPQFRVRTNSLQGNLVVKGYFNNFQLFSTKYLDYLD